MNIDACFPSRYLQASDLPADRDAVVVIARVTLEQMWNGKEKLDKPVLYFERKNKGMVLNKTNAKMIGRMIGTETNDWIGQAITIGLSTVNSPTGKVPGLRVRPELPAPPRANGHAAQGVAAMARPEAMTPAEAADWDGIEDVPDDLPY
jgi:hypothetical protein